MSYEQFEEIIKNLEQYREKSHSIYKLGINLMDYDELPHGIISVLLTSVFGKEGKDWIDWYLYERIGFDGKVLQAWDENDEEICHNIPSLWDTVKPYVKTRV